MNNYKRNSETWLQQVQKELNGKAMGDLEFSLDSQVRIDPIRAYLYDSKVDAKEAHLPKMQDLTYLRIFSANENKLVMEALEGGSSGIYYEFQVGFNLTDLAALTDGVLFEMIFQVFDISKCNFTKDSLADLLEKLKIPNEKFCVFDEKNKSLVDISEGEVCIPIYLLMEKLLQSDQLPVEPILFSPSTIFFTNIAVLRALRILLMNLDENYVPRILVVKDCSNGDIDFNQKLIECTCDTISSFIGGADFISLKPAANNSNQLRLLRNIPKLLELESEMAVHYDGMEGARNLTFLVDKITEEVWSKFKEQ